MNQVAKPPSTSISIESISQAEHALTVHWSDGKQSIFHYLWLRDNCASDLHPHSRESTFDQLSVTADIHPQMLSVEDQQLKITWSEHEHTSYFELQWLRQHTYSGELRQVPKSSYRSWDSRFVDKIPHVEYANVMASDRHLYDWMSALDRDGLVIVKNMPDTTQSVVDVAQRIDYLRKTNFGETFDVISVPKPINLAYTAIALPLHTDLTNQEVPPGYQFLHCLANDSEGGSSVFVDGLRVLEDMRFEQPAYFDLLAEHAIPFRFHDEAHDIRHHHPVINLNSFGEIVEIKYNAHLADIFDLPADIMHQYYLAYRDLMGRLREQRYKIKVMLQGGDMVVFDNRRVMHGRDAFDPSTGNRRLRGCYVDRTEFQSRLRVLAQQFDGE